jgi:hypothetical protein
MITIFSQDQLNQQVQNVLPDGPPAGKSGAIVGDVTSDGLQAAVVWKFDTGPMQWNAVADFQHTWSGDNSVGAKIVSYF